jgi:arabinofuranan 3-O-arabinosyltransferase
VKRRLAQPATVVSMFVLTLLAFVQLPGRVTFDTKLDMSVNPVGFLARSLHLWDPQSTAGELQNQAYGYLFPIGPFFALGQALHVPPWITQRLWCALLLCGAYLGALLLARALAIGSEPARHAAALAYALAPRMLTEVGSLSAEMLPAVLLPWVVLPLVRADRGEMTPRRAAFASGVAVLVTGGANAAMVIMALVLPGLWLLTRRFTARHLALIGWWCVAVTMAVLWWLIPLLLLGRYSLPFLAYIESSANTTAVASLFQAVRGTNQWVAYIVQGVPWWPSGWMLVDNPILMVVTMLVAAVGLAGLARPNLRERRFLVLAVLAGLLLLTIGYVGSLDSPLSTVARHLLDGPLAPFRNVHKFEPVIRLPLALGFAHGVPLLWTWLRLPWRRGHLRRPPDAGWATALPALVLVCALAAPAWLMTLRPGPGWADIPAYWRQAASWLTAQGPQARTLLVPASGFGLYTWGGTVDEPMQALAGAPWAVRSQVPLGSEGNTRVMDTVEDVLESGSGSPALADYLARAGYRFVLLRNDIDRIRTDAPPVSVVRQSLARSPGLVRAAVFGRLVTAADETSRSPADYGTRPVPSIEVFAVQRPPALVRAVPTSNLAVVSGGPESLLPLLNQGLIDRDRPTVLAGDRSGPFGGAWLVTDGLRRRERNVGRVHNNLSQTMTAAETPRQNRRTLDILPYPGLEHQTTAVYQGIRSITASTSEGFADAVNNSEPSYAPFAAIDGDPNTAWHSSSQSGPLGQWLEVDLDTPRRVDHVGLEFVDDLRVGWTVARFRITTDAGSVDHDVATGGGSHDYPAVPGLTTSVRITVLAMAGDRDTGNVGIRELAIADVTADRALRVPTDVLAIPGDLPAFAFTREDQAHAACFAVDGLTRCDPNLGRLGEEPHGIDRLFQTAAAGRYTLQLTGVPQAFGRNPVSDKGLTIEATSWLSGDPAVDPVAAIDGDRSTAWIADVGDRAPALRLSWTGPRRIDQIRLLAAEQPVASKPLVVELRAGTEKRLVRLSADGRARFAPMITDRLEIGLVGLDPRVLDLRGRGADAPVGVADLEIPALTDLMRPLPPNTPFSVPCGQGPVVTLDGVRIDTSVSGTLADVIGHRALPVNVCDLYASEGIDLAAGEHRLRATPSAGFVVQDAALRPNGWSTALAPDRPSQVERWQSTDRDVRIGPGPQALLVVPENANRGWVATLGGQALSPTRVDGWQQAWTVPAGPGGLVHLTFTPDRAYRTGLAAGGLAALGLVVVAVLPARVRPVRRAVRAGYGAPAGYGLTLVLIAMAALLGGVLPVVLVLVGLLIRQVRPRGLPAVTFGGAVVAAVVAVAGRLSGHGQNWAYNVWVQGAMLVAVCAMVAATLRIPGGAPLDDEPDGDEQAGGGGRGGGDLADRAVQAPGDEADLDAYRRPDHDDRAVVGAGDPREQQQLGEGEQRPGEREEPDGGERPAVAVIPRPADGAQDRVAEAGDNQHDRRVQAGRDE